MTEFNVGMERMKNVIISCVHLSQLSIAEKYCNMYIIQYFPYPNDNFELLSNEVHFLVKEKTNKINKKLKRKEKRINEN